MDAASERGMVSVVITNYNKVEFLWECLESIRKQSYRNWEIILIDDASTDDSVMQTNHWYQQQSPSFPHDNLFLLHTLPRKIGYAGAINAGFYLARGEYIAVQDADDISHELRLAKQVDYLQTHPEVDLVGSNYAAFASEQPEKIEIANWIRYGEEIKQVYASGGHCVCHGTVMFRKSLFDRIGGPSRRLIGAEDYEFIAKALNHRAKIENIPEVLYYYRLQPNQRSLQYYRKKGV